MGTSTPLTTLQRKDSTISITASRQEMIILPDLQAELKKEMHERRFAEGNTEDSNNGSMICFPVKDTRTGAVPLVIAVKSNATNSFTTTRKKRYEYVLRRFAQRIAMEYQLRTLKEAINP